MTQITSPRHQVHSPRFQVRSPSHQQKQKRKPAFYAFGGFVLGASAVGAVIGIRNAFKGDTEPSSLRGSNQKASLVPYAESGTSNGPEPSAMPTGSTAANSNDSIDIISTLATDQVSAPTPSPSITTTTYTPTTATYTPTASGLFPTDFPTQKLDSSRFIPKKRSNEVSFRLKLYWEGTAIALW
jgi:hypothetical protein